MKKINNRGFMIAELLAVTVAIMIIFMLIYSSFFPTLGELEKRNQYNDIDSKYATFYARVLYLKMFEENQTIETSTLESINTNNYITLVSNATCNSELFTSVTDFNTNCNELVAKLGIQELIFSSYDVNDIKTSYDGTSLKKYIKYLSSKSLDEGEQNLYRLIAKTNDGYATMSFYSQECSNVAWGEWTDWSINSCESVTYYRTKGLTVNKTYTDLIDWYNGWTVVRGGGWVPSCSTSTPEGEWCWYMPHAGPSVGINTHGSISRTINIIKDHEYYVHAAGQAVWNGSMRIKMPGYDETTNSPSIDTIWTATADNSSYIIGFWDNGTSSDYSVAISGTVVDLTATTGAGNEPSLAWCQSNLKNKNGTYTISTPNQFGEWTTTPCDITDTANCESKVEEVINDEYYVCSSDIKCAKSTDNETMNCTTNPLCQADGDGTYTLYEITGEPINNVCLSGSNTQQFYRYKVGEEVENYESNWSFAPCTQ